jgi:DNA-binding response OmpR family regulator
MNEKILLVDDEDSLRLTLKFRLSDAGFDVRDAADGEQALAALEAEPADLVLLDINMPRMDGIETLALILQSHPGTDVIMLTGFADFSTAIDCLKKGAKDYLVKPIEVTELITRVRSILRAKGAERSLAELQKKNSSLVLFDILPLLSSMQSLIAAVEKGKLSDDQQAILDYSLHVSQRLLGRTSTLVQINQLDSVKIDLLPADVDPQQFAETQCGRYLHTAAMFGVHFEKSIEKGLPHIRFDDERVGQALDLLVNAVFRAAQKGTKLTLSVSKGSNEEILFVLHVAVKALADDPGLLFPVYAEDADVSPESKRKDLGLAIAKRIAEEHGGKIWIETPTQKELVITLSLPAAKNP